MICLTCTSHMVTNTILACNMVAKIVIIAAFCPAFPPLYYERLWWMHTILTLALLGSIGTDMNLMRYAGERRCTCISGLTILFIYVGPFFVFSMVLNDIRVGDVTDIASKALCAMYIINIFIQGLTLFICNPLLYCYSQRQEEQHVQV